MEAGTRRLAAILAADVAGFSRLMGADEAGTLHTLTERRAAVAALVAAHGGRVVGGAGDSILVEFQSVVEAVTCAVEMQRAMRAANARTSPDRRIEFRVGINIGDVIVQDGTIYGDGVNLAARIEALAPVGGIAISSGVHDQVRNKLALSYRARGPQTVKNIAAPVVIYDIDLDAVSGPSAAPWLRQRGSKIAATGIVAAIAVAAASAALWTTERRIAEPNRATPETAAPSPPQASTESARPVVAVLPLATQGGEGGQDYLSDGITEDIITALSRFANLSVIARNTMLQYRGRSIDSATLTRELGARYLVDGTVRRSGDRVRVTAQLTDAASGRVLWSDRYDMQLAEIFALQDQIVRSLVGSMAVRLTRIEQERALTRPTTNLEAYDLFLRARAQLASLTRAGNNRARELLERAIALDPNYAAAIAQLGWTYERAVINGWTAAPASALQTAYELGQRAAAADPALADAQALLGLLNIYMGQDERGIAALDRAVALNPNEAETLATRGMGLVWAGRLDAAIADLESALRFDPLLKLEGLTGLDFAYYLTGRYADSITLAERVLARSPDAANIYIILAATYAQMGRDGDARRAAGQVLRLRPFFRVEGYGSLLRDAAQRERLSDGLRRAGLE
jgi:TolB-like protein/class 3 adenylate cyclase